MFSRYPGISSSRLIHPRPHFPQSRRFYAPVPYLPRRSIPLFHRHRHIELRFRPQTRKAFHAPLRTSSSSAHQEKRPEQQIATDFENKDNIAILGGGITGLSAAYWISDAFQNSHVTIFERADRLGGWMNTEPVQVPGGEILFDTGPKTLRPNPPNGLVSMQLISDLGLQDDILPIKKSDPAAQNRFVYFPDHLVHMPSIPKSLSDLIGILIRLWSEPVFNKLFYAAFHEGRQPPKRTDESVADFVSRRMHPFLAQNLVSAVFHGIYAGDIHRLSAQSILGPLWVAEKRWGSITQSVKMREVDKMKWAFCDDLLLQMKSSNAAMNNDDRGKTAQLLKNASVFTFRHGLSQLSRRLEEELSRRSNVTIHKSTEISEISRTRGEQMPAIQISRRKVNNPAMETSYHSKVVSTISPRALLPLVQNTLTAPPSNNTDDYNVLKNTIGRIPTVSVGVVNLYYTNPNLLQTLNPPGGLPSSLQATGLQGFGYLIPASIPMDQNPEFALGVQFDSDITPNLHTTVSAEKQGTKLTVMLGGHWWDGWSVLPSPAEAEEMAKSVLRRHLGITETPAYIRATMQRDCIPQYVVGHADRLREAHEALWRSFHGSLLVGGSWYSGVGVNDCIRAGSDLAQALIHEKGSPKDPATSIRRTGLEKFAPGGRPMALIKDEGGAEISIKETDESATRMGFWYALTEDPVQGSVKIQVK